MWGLAYEPTTSQSEIKNPIAIELEELNESNDRDYDKFAEREYVKDHPIEKIATLLEGVIAYFFEKVIELLYAFVNLLF